MAMSDQHKEALAVGRRESRAIRAYLDAIGNRRPGRPVTPETLTRRLAKIEEQLGAEGNPLKRVDLLQRQIDAKAALAGLEVSADVDALEGAFVDALPGYSRRKSISYAAWRAAGVPASLLKKSGLSRGS